MNNLGAILLVILFLTTTALLTCTYSYLILCLLESMFLYESERTGLCPYTRRYLDKTPDSEAEDLAEIAFNRMLLIKVVQCLCAIFIIGFLEKKWRLYKTDRARRIQERARIGRVRRVYQRALIAIPRPTQTPSQGTPSITRVWPPPPRIGTPTSSQGTHSNTLVWPPLTLPRIGTPTSSR